MIKKFLRLFRGYRELEKDLEREAALNDSLERHIDALEGRDRERADRIAELEAGLAEQKKLVRELKALLSRLLPEEQKERPGRTIPGADMEAGES
jgi:uncharacterized coiled-coil protein SlyX